MVKQQCQGPFAVRHLFWPCNCRFLLKTASFRATLLRCVRVGGQAPWPQTMRAACLLVLPSFVANLHADQHGLPAAQLAHLDTANTPNKLMWVFASSINPMCKVAGSAHCARSSSSSSDAHTTRCCTQATPSTHLFNPEVRPVRRVIQLGFLDRTAAPGLFPPIIEAHAVFARLVCQLLCDAVKVLANLSVRSLEPLDVFAQPGFCTQQKRAAHSAHMFVRIQQPRERLVRQRVGQASAVRVAPRAESAAKCLFVRTATAQAYPRAYVLLQVCGHHASIEHEPLPNHTRRAR